MNPNITSVDATRRDTGLSVGALHLRYIALGGTADRRAVTDHLLSAGALDATEHDLIVHALNERCLELGLDMRLPYSPDLGSD